MSSAICFNLDQSKILSSGNGLRSFSIDSLPSLNIPDLLTNCTWINPLPNVKFLDVTKLKAFADNKFKVAKMMIFLFDRAGNTVGKGQNAGYQHFLLFQQCFPKPSSLGSLSRECVVKT